jgi:hypothetical protein
MEKEEDSHEQSAASVWCSAGSAGVSGGGGGKGSRDGRGSACLGGRAVGSESESLWRLELVGTAARLDE